MTQESNGEINHNLLSVDEIKDYQNTDILEMLMEANAIEDESNVTESDLEAIKARAMVLAETNTLPAKTLFVMSYKDRMEYLGNIVDERLKQLPDEVIQGMVLAQTGNRLSSEEIELLRTTQLPFNQWINERVLAKEKMSDIHVAIDENDMVSGLGETSSEALHHAQEDRGIEEKSI